jgi:hypothetical protein
MLMNFLAELMTILWDCIFIFLPSPDGYKVAQLAGGVNTNKSSVQK